MRIYIILLLTVFFSCSNQKNNEKASQPKCRIKFETYFGFDSSEKENEPPKDTLISKVTFNYDKNENLIEVKYYDLKTNLVFSTEKRVFDDRGNIIEISFYNKNGIIDGKYIYKYDSLNNEILKETYWKGKFDGKLITTYNYKNMLVNVKYFNSDRSLESSNSFKIDEKGNHLEDYQSDGKISSKATFEYNDKGNIIKEHSETWEMDTTNLQVNYKYDQQNNEIMRTITDLNDNKVSTVKTEYVYDKFGNWTKKVITWSWLPDRQTTMKEIVYFQN